MIDIIDMLREMANNHTTTYDVQVLDDAIYEIERLRKTIAGLQQIAGKASIDGQTFAQVREEVRNGS